MNPVLETMASHRSIRAFTADEVDDETLARCVRAAQMAATSSHVQAYSLLRVRDPGERARLAELCGSQPQVERAGAFLVVCADARRHHLLCERAGAPCADNLESFLVAVIDAALLAQNLALACEGEGLGICYIGGLRNRLAEVDALLELPAHVFPLFGLCLGRPAEDPAPKPRLPLEALLFDGRYPADEELLAAVARHDREMARYYRERGKPGHDWSGGIVAKLRVARRTELLAYYRAKGARLE